MDTGQADMGNWQGNRQGRPGKVIGEATGRQGRRQGGLAKWQGRRQGDRGGDRGGLAKRGKMNKSPLLSTLYMMSQLTLIFYPHHTGMRSEMLYTNGSFEICQERMFVKQHWKHGWSIYLLPKKCLCSSKNRQISTW